MSLSAVRIVTLTFSVAGALISSVATTEACICRSVDASAACEQYKKADVAFVGRAIVAPPDWVGSTVRFRLTRALKGVAGSEVSVQNSMLCGYQFKEGGDYVVFATRDTEGQIEISACSSTIWMVHVPDYAYPEFRREAAEAVAFAASLRKPAAGGRIFGEIGVRVPFKAPDEAETVDGATVILRGPDPKQERRTTSVKGGYEFTRLPLGAYTVSVTMPDGLPPARSTRPPAHLLSQDTFAFDFEREFTRSITIGDARGCGYAPFEAEFDGEVAGTVVRHDLVPRRDRR